MAGSSPANITLSVRSDLTRQRQRFAASFDGRVTVRLTRHLSAEAAGSYGHADLRTSISGDFEAAYMGDTQPLANGNVFVGWGSEPYFGEYSRSGRLLFEGEFPGANLTYRATLEQWTGLPLSRPAGAARREGARTTVYASWNGATKVASWRVLAGPGAGRLAAVATAAKSGFETAIPLAQSYNSFEIQALDAGGRVIGTSLPFAR